MTHGPKTPFAQQLHQDKYRSPGESFDESMNRVAAGLTEGDPGAFHTFRDIIREQRFLPAGRIQSAIGAPKQVTAVNCFVSGTIADSFVDGEGSIMTRATEAAQTMRMGGGIGYDFSPLRPRNAIIKKLDSRSSGPISFMGIYDSICDCIASAGHRRGAQMGVLRVDHPDIVEFIHAKQNSDKLNGFNLSIGITDTFMEAVLDDDQFELKWGGEVYSTINARALWEKIMRSTWDWAEPGVLFIDRINQMNNLWYCELIAAVNPCGEQPLPPNGACILASFNLTKYILHLRDGSHDGGGIMVTFDIEQFKADIPHCVRAMDRVIDVTSYPLEDQEMESKAKRRMGLGVTGLANAGEALGHAYGSPGFLAFESAIMTVLRDECYRASIQLAKEKGPFPMFSADQYPMGEFIQTLPVDIQDSIAEHGIRNSHLLSIAPTGTISLCADNVSSGIEPVFAKSTRRLVQTADGQQEQLIEDYGFARWGVEPKVCAEVTAEEHLAVLQIAQQFVDSAVSKTCNVPSTMDWESFKQLYMDAWKAGCKGITTFQDGGKRVGILQAEPEDGEACRYDPETGSKTCD